LRLDQAVQSQSQCLLAGFAALARENEPSFQDARFGFSSGEIRSIVDVESGINRFSGPPIGSILMKSVAFCFYLTCAELVACAYLSTAGLTAGEVIDQGLQDTRIRYDVVDVSLGVVDALLAQPAESFKRASASPPPKIGIGDTVSVSIWERAVASSGRPPLRGSRRGRGSSPLRECRSPSPEISFSI
jgi:hypothetical protein